MVFRGLVFALAVCTVSDVVLAQPPRNGEIRDYADSREMDVTRCKLGSLNARVSQSLASDSPDATKAKHEYWDCLSKASRDAKENLPKALNSTKSKEIKDALKNLYVAWDAYMGDLGNRKSKTLQDSYETAKSKLEVELLSQ